MVPADTGLRTRSLDRAARAFTKRDSDASRAAHAPRSIEDEPHKSNHIKHTTSKVILTCVTSGSSGLIASSLVFIGMLSSFTHTTFLSHDWLMIVKATAIIVVVSSGAALAFADASNRSAEIAFYNTEKKRESWEYDNYIEGEQREMVELYSKKGMSTADAEVVVSLLSKYKDLFVDIMMAEELQLMPVFDRLPPLGTGVTVWTSYVTFGLLPLSPLFASEYFMYPVSRQTIIYLSVLVTGAALFGLGVVKSYFGSYKWWQPACVHLLNGAVAVGLAVGVGVYVGDRIIPHYHHHT